MDSSPDQSAQLDMSWWWLGVLVWVLLCLFGLKPELGLNGNHAHYLYSTDFCNEKQFFLYEDKGKHHRILLPAVFVQMSHGLTSPFMAERFLPPCSPLQPIRNRGCSESLLVEPHASQFSCLMLDRHITTCPPSTATLVIHETDQYECEPIREGGGGSD